jgi:hypothetical protein
MTELKPGDRVTSPLLVGEWEVDQLQSPDLPAGWVWVRSGASIIPEAESRLTLVAPPLPPEPPVGLVVFVDGVTYVNDTPAASNTWSAHNGGRWKYTPWSDIAARAVPAVDPTNDEHLRDAGLCRVEDVARWLARRGIRDQFVLEFRARFGGAS